MLLLENVIPGLDPEDEEKDLNSAMMFLELKQKFRFVDAYMQYRYLASVINSLAGETDSQMDRHFDGRTNGRQE